MAGFNKVFLMGNLTRDPQLSYTPNQTAVVDFGIATNRRWTGQDGNQRQETCFADCRAFGKLAENINKYLTKGRAVFIEGRLTFESWTAQDGTKRSRHRVTVENFQFLPGTGGEVNSNEGEQFTEGHNASRQDGGMNSTVQPPMGATTINAEDTHDKPIDDIPF